MGTVRKPEEPGKARTRPDVVAMSAYGRVVFAVQLVDGAVQGAVVGQAKVFQQHLLAHFVNGHYGGKWEMGQG